MYSMNEDFVDSCKVLFDYLQRNNHAVASMLTQYSKQFISKRKEFKGYKVQPKLDRIGGRLYLEIYTPKNEFAVYSDILEGVVILSDIPKNITVTQGRCLKGLIERLHPGVRSQVEQVLAGYGQIPFIVFGPVDMENSYDRKLVKLILIHIFKHIFKDILRK